MRSAKPSTTAVLPTPASPVRIGLFWRRRIRMSTIWRISSSRPTIGSISPLRACSVRSTANFFSASCLPIAAGAIAPLASPGSPPTPEPSLARRFSSGEPAMILANSSASTSGLIFSNSFEMPSSRLAQRTRLQHAEQQMPGADLRFAKLQRAIDPAALDRIGDVLGQVGDRGRAARQPVERVGDVLGQHIDIEVEVLDRCGASRCPAHWTICISQCSSST